MTNSKAFYIIILFFVLTITEFTNCNPHGSYHIEVNIFLEESNDDTTKIVQNAVERYQFDHMNGLLEKAAHLNIKLVRYNRTISSIFTLEQDHFFNLSSKSLCSSIFVYTSNHELVLSSLMERSNIVTVGLFQTYGIPWTQESPTSFTRITSPSMLHYARAMQDMVKKMGWRTISLVLSADYESKVFADAICEYSGKEKWDILHTVWLLKSRRNSTELKSMIKVVMTNDSDVVIVHVSDCHNDELFRLVKKLGVNQLKAPWLLTDITTSGVLRVKDLPVGFVRISPWRNPTHEFIKHALYDAIHLIALSATSAVKMSRDNKKLRQSINDGNTDLQRLMKKRMNETFFQGKSSLFEDPDSVKGPYSTMNIFNMNLDLSGHKHWASVGLRTYSGIALETISAPNGKVLNPFLVPPRPTLRVPVILYPPWIEAEEPQDTYERKMTCLKRGYFCYNETGITITKLCCFGFSIDLLKILERELGFVPEIYFIADGKHGNFDETTGKWNGIVDELVTGKGDLALDLPLSGERAKHIEFSFPYLPLALNVLVEKEGRSKQGIQWYSWLKPFDVRLWLTILGTCNVILLVIWWLDRKSPTGYYQILKETDEDGFTLLDAMSYVWGVAFSKDIGAEKSPRSTSARFVSTVYAFMTLIIVNTYCANLMAFLVQEEFVLPIKGITDPKLRDPSFYAPNGFQLGILQGTFAEMYFKNHINYELRQLYNTNLKTNLMPNFAAGINTLEKDEIQGLIGDYLSLRQSANKIPGCRYCLAGPNFYTHGIGFAVPKGSPWLNDITRVVLEMKTNGSINTLEKMYFDKKSCRSSVAKDLSIVNFSGLFLTVAVTITFCFLALLAEVIAIFVLVRFSPHLGVIGKFSMRLLFDLKKGEEHLITLKYSTMRKKCIKMDLIRIENSSPTAATTVEMKRHSMITTQSYLEELQPEEGCHTSEGRGDGNLNESFESNSNSRLQMPQSNGLCNEGLTAEVTFL